MIFGIPLEIRQHENRVGAAPFLVEELVKRGHQVLVESKAGLKSGFSDEAYENSGALVVPSAEKLYAQADIILKVQAPTPVEYDLIRPEHIIFAFYYFLNNPELARSLIARGCSCFAYEMLTLENGQRPLFDIQSEIAGRVAILQGMCLLQTATGGRGILPGGATGAHPAQVVILGAGPGGQSAAISAAHQNAEVIVLDSSFDALQKIASAGITNLSTMYLNEYTLRQIFPGTDLVICARQEVISQPQIIVSRDLLQLLPEGAVIIDLDIELGGSVETSHPTTFGNPTFVQDGVIHYCVPNLPGVVPLSASPAHSSALLPCLLRFTSSDFETIAREDEEFRSGIMIFEGRVPNSELAGRLNVSHYAFNEDES